MFIFANVHRVISPQQRNRYSVAYFIALGLFAGGIPILTLPEELPKIALLYHQTFVK